MADASKKSKVSLPPGWIVRFSKKHPDRPCYFNESTGQSRWTVPLDEEEKVKKTSSPRGRKRKTLEEEEEIQSEESSDATNAAAKKLLNAIINNRPKLKAKGKLNLTANTGNESNDDSSSKESADTPAMRLYREKLAQRKAVQEAKKNGSKTHSQKKNQTPLPAMKVPLETTPSTSQAVQPRRTRRSSAVSGNESVSSNCSTVSTSSLGSKVAMLAKRAESGPPSPILSKVKKFPKIPKVKIVKANVPTTKSDVSDSETLTDISNADCHDEKHRFVANNVPLKKNCANERLDNFRKSLEKPPNKRRCGTNINNNNNLPSSPRLPDKSKLLNSPSPILCDKAQSRLYSLEEQVQSSCQFNLNKSKQSIYDENESLTERVLIEKAEGVDSFCEEMEWEPIEDEKIMSEVYSVRHQLCNENEKAVDKLWGQLSCDELRTLNTASGKNALYIVIDTNVFLSNLSFVEEVRDSHSDIFGRPFIVIPWTVLQELDYIKDNKNKERSQPLRHKARKAVNFLNQHFKAKHPRFLGQTPADVQLNKLKFMTECPDDEILQTCLQIKEWSKTPVLLSYDKNLCNKAMIHDVPILGKNEPIEKVFYLKAAETTDFLANSLHAHMEETQDDLSTSQQELLLADDIMEEGKATLKSVLSAVVAKEMKVLFGDRWEMHVIIRPPWSIQTVLKCALKHWMAAVSESFLRKTEPMLHDLQTIIKNSPDCGRKLQDVKHFLNKCNEVFQTLNGIKYPSLKSQALRSIETLKERCINSIKEINDAKFNEVIGSENDACEAEKRASLAFKLFEDVYAFARDLCGVAADIKGLNCAFTYNKAHPFITPAMACRLQQEVGTSVNKLLQILRLTLSKVEEGIQPSDRAIVALHQTLVNFCSDLNSDDQNEVSPLDVFCCVKLRNNMLERGCLQLQDLAVHFCRLANYECK